MQDLKKKGIKREKNAAEVYQKNYKEQLRRNVPDDSTR
jgi:hypothetical protein